MKAHRTAIALVLGATTVAVSCTTKLIVSDDDDQDGAGGASGSGSTDASSGGSSGGIDASIDAPTLLDASGGDSPPVWDGSYNYTPWTGNAADCPAAPPQDLGVCTLPEGQFCTYFWSTQYGYNHQLCACWEASSTVRKWSCSGYFGTNAECPTTTPATGDSCWGHVNGGDCHYPERTTCSCPENGTNPTWVCKDQVPEFPAPPAGLDPNKPIQSLTDTERQLWCNWYVFARLPPGSPGPLPSPLSADGYLTNFGYSVGWKHMCNACLPTIPVAYCVGNLSLSTCAAPLSELTDCISTIWDECYPTPHGCGRYFDKPGCSGTIAVAHGSESSFDAGTSCSIDVK